MLKSVSRSFIASRVYIFLAATLGYYLLPTVQRGKSVPLEEAAPWFLSIWYRWDANWYMSIVSSGYEWVEEAQSNVAFFPLYPLLVRVGGWLLGGRFLLAGLLLSTVCLFAALIYLYRLVEEDYGAEVAGRAVWFISIFPTAFFFQSFYSESLFLLTSVAAFYHARKGNWAQAGLWGFLATLTRVTGLLLIIPLLWEYLAHRSFSIRRIRPAITWLALVPCGLLIYMGYLYQEYRRPFLFAQIQVDAWSHKFTPFFSSLEEDIHLFLTKTYEAWVVYDIIAVLFLLALTVVSFKYLRGSYSIYMLVSLLFVLVGGSVRSMSRYTLVIFPVFILLALFTADRTTRWSISAVSLGILGITTGIFASGRWIA